MASAGAEKIRGTRCSVSRADFKLWLGGGLAAVLPFVGKRWKLDFVTMLIFFVGCVVVCGDIA